MRSKIPSNLIYNHRLIVFAMLIGINLISCQKQQNFDDVTIYIVRHAEKASNDTMQNIQDPDLSEAGYKRAKKLSKLMANVSLNSLFSTNYIRTRKTLEDLSKVKKIDIVLYKANEATLLLDSLMEHGSGKTYLISGHSNTILPMISYLNGALPQPSILENEYDKLFKLTVLADTTIVERTVY